MSPAEDSLRRLHEALRPLVHAQPPERDWLPLMRLYRNKAAHLGSSVFRQIVRYGFSSGVALLVHLLVLHTLVEEMNVHKPVATTIGFLL